MAKRVKATILFATETGKSQDYAKTLCEIFKHAFDAKVSALICCIITFRFRAGGFVSFQEKPNWKKIFTPPRNSNRHSVKRHRCQLSQDDKWAEGSIFFFLSCSKMARVWRKIVLLKRFNSLRQHPEGPLAAQICSQKLRGRKTKSKRCCSQSHTLWFSSRFYLICLLVFKCDQSHKRTISHVCVSQSGCVEMQGRCKRPRQSFLVVGAEACFLFTPLLSLCVCETASAARGRQTPCRGLCITAAWCVAAAYYHLVRGEDRVVITTYSGANGCVFDHDLHALVICGLKCARRRPESDVRAAKISFCLPAGHVHGWIRCGGPGARDAGFSGDQYIWQRGSTWEWRGIYRIQNPN